MFQFFRHLTLFPEDTFAFMSRQKLTPSDLTQAPFFQTMIRLIHNLFDSGEPINRLSIERALALYLEDEFLQNRETSIQLFWDEVFGGGYQTGYSGGHTEEELPLLLDLPIVIERLGQENLVSTFQNMVNYTQGKLLVENSDPTSTILALADDLKQMIEMRSIAGRMEEDEIQKYLKSAREIKNSYRFGYPLLDSKIEGLENELYLLGGASGMGKSTFISNLAYHICQENPELHVITINYDHSNQDTLARFIAFHADIPVSYVKKPDPINMSYETRRKDSLKAMMEIVPRLSFFDLSAGPISILDLKRIIRKAQREDAQVCLIIDSIENITSDQQYLTPNQGMPYILKQLKFLSRTFKIPVIGSFSLSGDSELKRPERNDLANIPSLLNESYCVMTIFSESQLNFETPFIEWEWGTDDVMVPIMELKIEKHKMTAFKDRLFYRYFDSRSFYRECVEVECENYREMIKNVEYYDNKRKQKPKPENENPQF